MEPTGGFSTYCRKCGQHFRIEPPAKSTAKGLFSRLIGTEKAPVRVQTSHRQPSMPLQVRGYSEEANLFAESKPNTIRPAGPPKTYRNVVCFDCQHPHKVVSASTSSLCPSCGSYIDLRDVIIKERTTQKIRTRGDVTVEKKGALLGTSITCGNLTVEGQIAGSIHASGTVIFRASGKILGEVRCQHLVIEKKCEVQFLQPIHAETGEISGSMSGSFHFNNRLFLTRRGSILGLVQAPSMLMEIGGQLDATLAILPHPIPPPPAWENRPPPAEIIAPEILVIAPAESLADWASEASS